MVKKTSNQPVNAASGKKLTPAGRKRGDDAQELQPKRQQLSEIYGTDLETSAEMLHKCLTIGTIVDHPEAVVDTTVFLRELKPDNLLEAALISQMALVHKHSMTVSGMLGLSTTLETIEGYSRVLTRLNKAFVQLVQAYESSNGPGRQTVNVANGGQAIVSKEVSYVKK